MAAKQKTDVKRDHVVVCVMRRGLNQYTRLIGPFTKGEASAYAMHNTRFQNGDEYSVEQVTPLPRHEQWILRDVQA